MQSSLHIDEGMGVTTQAVLYVTLVFSCLFLPKIVLRYLGHKWTIPVMFIGYISWLAANGYVCVLINVAIKYVYISLSDDLPIVQCNTLIDMVFGGP